ncbi:Uma2 family endonuclease [Benzoatithermus flavus]|uniref:Uma2 family endonuclease n=1 Tax=Benzoatithermus flavus TaxID=3108223 RepID=A0ABU8XVY4_9PROT
MQDGARWYELRYDAATDSLLVRLATVPPETPVRQRTLEGGLLVVHAREDGQPVAWEVRQASRAGPLLSQILASLREISGALDALVAEAPRDFAAFLAWEAAQDGAFERLRGEVRRKAGGDDAHARLIVNLFAALDQRWQRADQRLHLSSLRVVSPKAEAVLYPPVVVRRTRAGAEPDKGEIEPVLVAEVVPEDADQAALAPRLEAYEAIPALRRILLLTLGRPRVVWRVRDAAGRWQEGKAEGRAAQVALDELGLVLPLDAVYAGPAPA